MWLRIGQDEAGSIIQAIKQLVQERRDGYEELRLEWPEWRQVLESAALGHTSPSNNLS